MVGGPRRRVIATALVAAATLCVALLAVVTSDDGGEIRLGRGTTTTGATTTTDSSTAAPTSTSVDPTTSTAAPVSAPPSSSAPAAPSPTDAPSATTPAARATAMAVPPARTPWFSPSASWNRPAAEFGVATELQPYADRLWNFGGGAAPAGTFNVAFSEYSVPVYPLAEASEFARAYQTTWSMELFGFGAPLGQRIPWNPAWRPGTGNDNLLAVVDESTGRAWELSGVGQQNTACANRANVAAATRDNDGRSRYLCLSDLRMYDNLFTASDGSTVDGRGGGINKMALLTRAEEVKTGTIRHALELTIASTMFGQPACAPTQGASAPGAGVSCGFFLPPATKLERTNPDTGCPTPQVVTDAERAKTVPEGMRFAINVTDGEIEQWLDARGYRGPLRNTARVFAVALRDYGWIVAETGCWGMHIETDSVIGAQSLTWQQLGVSGDGSAWPRGDLLAGLITPGRMYVVRPPG
ncbi:MAG: hypothetical protein U0Q22_01560 [Acidimicrobiales bacterium]